MLVKHGNIVKALSSRTVNRFNFFQMKFSKSMSRSVALDLERLSSGMISRKVLNFTEPYFPPETLSSPLGVLVPLSGCIPFTVSPTAWLPKLDVVFTCGLISAQDHE